jgi:hypothetical protein
MMRMNDEGGIDFSSLIRNPDESQRAMEDVVTLTKILFYACKPQADKLQLGLSDFAESLDGSVFPLAVNAFCEALNDFFQPEGKATPPAANVTS